MIAGRMKYKLVVYEPNRVTDRMGSERTDYIEKGTIWGERVKESARRSNEVGEHFPEHSAEFNVRDQHSVNENWRVQVKGEHLYNVVAIVPNKDKGYKTLLLERVNK